MPYLKVPRNIFAHILRNQTNFFDVHICNSIKITFLTFLYFFVALNVLIRNVCIFIYLYICTYVCVCTYACMYVYIKFEKLNNLLTNFVCNFQNLNDRIMHKKCNKIKSRHMYIHETYTCKKINYHLLKKNCFVVIYIHLFVKYIFKFQQQFCTYQRFKVTCYRLQLACSILLETDETNFQISFQEHAQTSFIHIFVNNIRTTLITQILRYYYCCYSNISFVASNYLPKQCCC